MAMSYTPGTPVHVSAYWRFRLNRLEYVNQHWRSLPTRWVLNLIPLSQIKLSDKSEFFSLVTGGYSYNQPLNADSTAWIISWRSSVEFGITGNPNLS